MKRLLNKIEKKGITKKHLAMMVGVDTSTLSRILSGKQQFTSQQLIDRIDYYLDSLNTDDKNILTNRSI